MRFRLGGGVLRGRRPFAVLAAAAGFATLAALSVASATHAANAHFKKGSYSGNLSASTVNTSERLAGLGQEVLIKGTGQSSFQTLIDVSPTTSRGFCGPVTGFVQITWPDSSTAGFTFVSKWGQGGLVINGSSNGESFDMKTQTSCDDPGFQGSASFPVLWISEVTIAEVR
jgi:hypothetical protein